MSDVGRTWDAMACHVFIDGQRVADGSLPGDNDAAPFVLAGLSVTWGRASTVEQPAAGTATFTLKDWSGDRAFLDLARVARIVEIYAVARIDEPATNVVTDPTLSHFPLGQQPYIGMPGYPGGIPPRLTSWPDTSLSASTTKVAGGLQLVDAWTDGTFSGVWNHRDPDVSRPPADGYITPPSPAAWDSIRSTNAGQDWTVRLTGTLGLWATGTVRPVGLRSPTSPSDRVALGTAVPLTAGTGLSTVAVTAPESGLWIGAVVKASGRTYADAPALTYAAAPAAKFSDLTPYTVTRMEVLGPASTSTQTARVFTGRITDAVAGFRKGVEVSVTAIDHLGALAQRLFGAEPWPGGPGMSFARRIDDILYYAGLPAGASDLTIDPPWNNFGGWPPEPELSVASLDVDSASALDLLQQHAAGHDLVLWTASHVTVDEPWLWIENPRRREPVAVLAMGTGGLLGIVPAPLAPSVGSVIPACDLDLDPVTWTQSAADVVTRVSVEWQYQSMDEDGFEGSEGRSLIRSSALDGSDLYGTRSATLASMTTSEDVAAELADGLLQRLSGTGWRVSGLRWDMTRTDDATQDDVTRALPLLDSRARLGRPVMLTELPDLSPRTGNQGGYLEGGTYSYTGDGWVLDMTLSAGQGIGAGVTYAEILSTGWRYPVAGSITYADVMHVGL